MVDARADVFAVGVMVYEMLAGVRPFEETDAFELMHALLQKMPHTIRAVVPNLELPRPLHQLLWRCLAKDRGMCGGETAVKAMIHATAKWPPLSPALLKGSPAATVPPGATASSAPVDEFPPTSEVPKLRPARPARRRPGSPRHGRGRRPRRHAGSDLPPPLAVGGPGGRRGGRGGRRPVVVHPGGVTRSPG